ncbi:MAG: hypothetical protein AB7K24_19495 [Gemmataceae bacterium]
MRRVLIATCLFSLLLGCSKSGPPTFPVAGTVTYNGEPIAAGDILFIPDDASLKREGGRIKEGKFQFEATAGKKRVEITAQRDHPTQKNPKGGPVPVDYIPANYNTASTLTAEVKPEGKNEFTFPLVGND